MVKVEVFRSRQQQQTEKLVRAITKTLYKHGEGLTIATILGALELAKVGIIGDADKLD